MRRMISTLAALAVLALIASSATLSIAGEATSQKMDAKPAPEVARVIDGTLLKIDGEFYVVQDPAGKEVRLHVSKETKQLGGSKEPGDKIRAEVTNEGHAISIQ